MEITRFPSGPICRYFRDEYNSGDNFWENAKNVRFDNTQANHNKISNDFNNEL